MIERMEISKEDKQSLVEQIVGFCGSRPLVYLKFTSCEEYANDILNGKLYANTPKYFRELELQSGERGQGDRFELENIIEATEFMMTDFETNEVIMKGTGGSLSIQYKDDENLPLVSLVGIPLEEMDLAYADENHANFLFPFSGEEYEKMSEKFGEYCVIIDGKELDRRIINYAEENNCDYIFDKIEYCYQNTLDRIISFQKEQRKDFYLKIQIYHIKENIELLFLTSFQKTILSISEN